MAKDNSLADLRHEDKLQPVLNLKRPLNQRRETYSALGALTRDDVVAAWQGAKVVIASSKGQRVQEAVNAIGGEARGQVAGNREANSRGTADYDYALVLQAI